MQLSIEIVQVNYRDVEAMRELYRNEAGKIPAARCDPSNFPSCLTLEKAGFLPCGFLLAGEVRNPKTA